MSQHFNFLVPENGQEQEPVSIADQIALMEFILLQPYVDASQRAAIEEQLARARKMQADIEIGKRQQGLSESQFDEAVREFERAHALDLAEFGLAEDQFGELQRQFDKQQGLDEKRYQQTEDELRRRYDLDRGEFQFDQQVLGVDIDKFNRQMELEVADLGLRQAGLKADVGMFNSNLGFEADKFNSQLNFEVSRFNKEFGLDVGFFELEQQREDRTRQEFNQQIGLAYDNVALEQYEQARELAANPFDTINYLLYLAGEVPTPIGETVRAPVINRPTPIEAAPHIQVDASPIPAPTPIAPNLVDVPNLAPPNIAPVATPPPITPGDGSASSSQPTYATTRDGPTSSATQPSSSIKDPNQLSPAPAGYEYSWDGNKFILVKKDKSVNPFG